MTESALKPIRLHLAIYGSGDYDGDRFPFPQTYIRDALSQNILFHCYETPKTVEQLSELCGVPAYYVEDSLRNLSARGAVTTPGPGADIKPILSSGRMCMAATAKKMRKRPCVPFWTGHGHGASSRRR